MFACEVSASIDWARLSVRGSRSRLIAVTFAAASLPQPRVRQRLEQSDEGPDRRACASTSRSSAAYAEQHVSLGVDLVAVDHRGAGSDVGGVGYQAACPAPDSTTTAMPAATSG